MSRSGRSSPISATCGRNRDRLSRASYAGFAALFAASVGLLAPAAARTLEAVQSRGAITLCAHANALPFSSRNGSQAGFQIELGRALAGQLGVELAVAWVVSPNQYRTADCDIILDTIINPDVQEQTRVRVSKPYHRTGVALAVPGGAAGIDSFADLGTGRRVGVQVGSLAQMLLSQRGVQTVPFGFEDEIMDELSTGALAGAAVSPAAIGYFNRMNPGKAVRLVHAYEREPALSWNVGVGMRGSDNLLRQRIDEAIDRLLADGTIRTIYARYGIEHRPPIGAP
jgi:polar amino acid transport system substrate-binding protein